MATPTTTQPVTPATVVVVSPQPSNAQGFSFEEAVSTGKDIVTVYGPKGAGKTTGILGLSGKKYIISFDGKTQRIKDTIYQHDANVVVLDGRAYFPDMDKKTLPAEGDKTIAYLEYLIDQIKERGDAQWIIFDYVPKLSKIAEMKMRKDNNLGATEGFANRSLWEDRNIIMRKLMRRALGAVGKRIPDRRCGIAFVTYIQMENTSVVDGETLASMKKPKYNDAIEAETDITLYAYTEKDKKDGKVHNFFEVESNKCWLPVSLRPAGYKGLGIVENGTILDLSGARKLSDLIADL